MPDIDDVFNYVMESPDNTNPNVLRSLLNGLEGGGGTNVVANPTLAGDEDSLTGIQIGDTKYAVGGSSGGGVLVVHQEYDGETLTLDKTWQEIYDAGFSVLELSVGGRTYGVLAQISESGGDYAVVFVTFGQSMSPRIYVADSADGYPVYTANP